MFPLINGNIKIFLCSLIGTLPAFGMFVLAGMNPTILSLILSIGVGVIISIFTKLLDYFFAVYLNAQINEKIKIKVKELVAAAPCNHEKDKK
jgi:hypothetical protein